MCSSQLPSTRFRAIVETTSDGSQPLLTGAWESLSHRCRLPVQAKPVQTPDTSFVLVRLTDYGVCAPYQMARGCPVLQVIKCWGTVDIGP